MASPALDGASKYLNNLLLSRGFLQDGKAIDFSQLASDDDKFDRNAATARVINLVHDLVLRRDKDAEQKEALASTIHALRREESQRILDLQKIQDKNVQLKNELATSEASQRSLDVATKKAQAETKELKEQVLKLKSTLDQVRAKCISDMRKRDVELDKLKNHLSGLNRGKKESASGGMKVNIINVRAKSMNHEGRPSQDIEASQWSLENETNDFLAAVLNETSAENVALRKIVGDSMKYLRSLTGLDEDKRKPVDSLDNAIGIPGQYRDRSAAEPSVSQSDSLVPVQQLASSMSEVLSHCQSILRDPSFVPIEEVQMRDEEIAKLKAGWEKMADRWKEAVTMMSSWRQKMLGEGEQEHSGLQQFDARPRFDAEGLFGIPAFGRSVAMRPDGQPVLDPIEEEELTSMLMEHHSRIDNQSAISNGREELQGSHDDTLPESDQTGTPRQPTFRIHEDADAESELASHEAPQPQIMASPARRGIKIRQCQDHHYQPLTTSNANSKKRKSPATTSSPRKRRSMSPEARHESTREHPEPVATSAAATNSSMIASSTSTDPFHLDTLTSDVSGDEAEDVFLDQEETSRESKSKIPRMTIAQKLAQVESEATEATEVIRRRQATTYSKDDRRARDRERNEKVKSTKSTSKSVKVLNDVKSGDLDKRKDKSRKARDRRRSTLTPAELGSLMGR